MYPHQEQIIALASLVEKIKDNNLNLSKSFKVSPSGKDKGKGKVKFKVQGKNHLANSSNMEKGKMSGRSKSQKMERPTPIK